MRVKNLLFVLPFITVFALVVTGTRGQAQIAVAPKGKIAFSRMEGDNAKLCVVNADGTNLHELPVKSAKYCLYSAWSPDGKRLAYTGVDSFMPAGMSEVYLVNADGSDEKRVTNSGFSVLPAWSPDGKSMLCSRKDGDKFKLQIVDLDGTLTMEFTGSDMSFFGFWSPDGKRIACTRPEPMTMKAQIYLQNVDGSAEEMLTSADGFHMGGNGAWSPDGKRIAVTRFDFMGKAGSLWLVDVVTKSESLVTSTFDGELKEGVFPTAAWSPDGKWLAAAIISNGNGRIYVMSPDGATKKAITPEGQLCFAPTWTK